MKRILKIPVLLMVFWLQDVVAQDYLSVEDALRLGLENNYGIRLGKQDFQLAENNNSPGNAGFLPRLNLTAGQTNSVTDSRQAFLTGQVNDRSGAKSDAFNAGLQLNWTIFDGMKMFVRRDQLSKLQESAGMELLLTVENTISNIHLNYFTLVQRIRQKKVVENTLAIGNERLRLAEDKLRFGSGSRLEVLQARVDLHSDSATYLNLLDLINRSMVAVNTLLGRDPGIRFTVDEQILLLTGLRADSLEKQMLSRNTQLLLSRNDEQLATLALKELRSKQLPELGINLGYNFLNQHSQSGFLAENRSLGLAYGATASMSLFNGFNTRREIKNMQLQIESSRLRVSSLENELVGALRSAFMSYASKQQLMQMETHNLGSARENLNIATERYNLGDLSGIEFREAQRNYLEAETRLLVVVLEIKILETQLLQLAGMLKN